MTIAAVGMSMGTPAAGRATPITTTTHSDLLVIAPAVFIARAKQRVILHAIGLIFFATDLLSSPIDPIDKPLSFRQ